MPMTLRDRGLGFQVDDPRFDPKDPVAGVFAGSLWLAGLVSKNRDVYQSPVRDQEQTNGCTGFSGRLAVQIALARAIASAGGDPRDVPELSALFAWYHARSPGDRTANVGCTIRDFILSAKQYGLCLEQAWPFEEVNNDWKQRLKVRPDDDAYNQAARHQLLEAYRIPDRDVGAIQAALRDGYPVQFGFPVYESFFDTPHDTGVVQNFAGKFVGYHAVTAQDADVVNGAGGAWIQNSWGKTFGKDGWCFFPIRALETAQDLWVPTMAERLD